MFTPIYKVRKQLLHKTLSFSLLKYSAKPRPASVPLLGNTWLPTHFIRSSQGPHEVGIAWGITTRVICHRYVVELGPLTPRHSAASQVGPWVVVPPKFMERRKYGDSWKRLSMSAWQVVKALIIDNYLYYSCRKSPSSWAAKLELKTDQVDPKTHTLVIEVTLDFHSMEYEYLT